MTPICFLVFDHFFTVGGESSRVLGLVIFWVPHSHPSNKVRVKMELQLKPRIQSLFLMQIITINSALNNVPISI